MPGWITRGQIGSEALRQLIAPLRQSKHVAFTNIVSCLEKRSSGSVGILRFPETVLATVLSKWKNRAANESSVRLERFASRIEQFKNPVHVVNTPTPRATPSALQGSP